MENLPDELLSRIFTIAAETPVDLWTEPADGDYIPYPLIRSLDSGRKIKKVIKSVVLVSKRWKFLVDHPSNAHLWFAVINIDSDHDDLYCHQQIIRLLNVLRSSKGCDLDITWSGDRPSFLSGTSNYLTENRIFLHGLRMIQEYGKQLHSLTLCWSRESILKCHFAFLNGLGVTPRLELVELRYRPHYRNNAAAQISDAEEQDFIGCFNFGHQDYRSLVTTGLVSIVHLELFNARIFRSRFHLPQTLVSLRLVENEFDEGVPWKVVVASLRQCTVLQRLDISILTVVDLPPIETATTLLPKVHSLRIQGDCTTITTVLGICDWSNINSCVLIPRDTRYTSIGFSQTIFLPSVTIFGWGGPLPPHSPTLDQFHFPKLQKLILIAPSETMVDHLPLWQDIAGTANVTLRAPRTLRIKNGNPIMVLWSMLQLDLNNVESLFIDNAPPAGLDEAPGKVGDWGETESPSRTMRQLHLPNLVNICVRSYGIQYVTPILDCIHIPRLTSLRLDCCRADTPTPWRCLTQDHLRVFQQIRNLTIDLHSDIFISKDPFIHFPGVIHLTINNIAARHLFDLQSNLGYEHRQELPPCPSLRELRLSTSVDVVRRLRPFSRPSELDLRKEDLKVLARKLINARTRRNFILAEVIVEWDGCIEIVRNNDGK